MSSVPALNQQQTLTAADSSALWPSLLKGRISEAVERGELTVDHLPEIRALVRAEELRCAPMSRVDMVKVLEPLFLHYFAPALSEGAQAQKWRDWHEDVGHLPGWVLAEAARKWRRSAAKHAPSPGQLLALIPADYRVRLLAAQRAERLLSADRGVDN